jgi:[ribosomal protein S5]-alanine N-acetyltransferase
MESVRIELRDGYYLSGIAAGDEDAFITHYSDGKIGEMIPALPHPYGREEAEKWVRHRIHFRDEAGAETTFAIRRPGGFLVGCVGVDDYPVRSLDTAELGYWLAPVERGRGLAVSAVVAFLHYGFFILGLSRITACTLACNPASARVLEKTGFQRVGVKTQYTTTRAGTFDTLFFELPRERCP